MLKARYAFVIVFMLVTCSARLTAAIPTDELLNSLHPAGDVNDFAGLLTPAEKEQLETRCRQLRERSGAQLAVVTLKSLQGGEVDDFTNKLFARWHIGQKEAKNGLLLLVAMDEHKSRIEVGYGLEPIIPDVLAARILDHELRPRFRQQQFAQGLSAAVNQLCELVERNEPADRAALEAEKQNGDATWFAILFLTLFVVVGALIGGVGAGQRVIPILLFGLAFAGMALLVGMGLSWPLAPLIQVPISLATFGWGYYVARHGGGTGGQSGRNRGGTPWDWGNFGGASSGGWSSGGGGFSQDWGGFGGGSSGGGGASSDW